MVPPSEPPSSAATKVLVVVDDPGQRQTHAQALKRAGYPVSTAASAGEALALLGQRPFDCVVSALPGTDDVQLLRQIRERQLDVPVIVTTASPSVAAAAQAVEWDAFRYLTAPVESDHLLEVVGLAARAHHVARLRLAAYAYLERIGFPTLDQPGLAAQFDRALSQIWMAFQPIVAWPNRRVVGYEALLRSRDPVLSRPLPLLEAAEQLGRVHDLGRVIRHAVADATRHASADLVFFVNLHARDLLDPRLYSPTCPLSTMARRVVLEITERASIDQIEDVHDRVAKLRRLGYRIAVDDLGAGYAGLSSFAQLKPDAIKLDMTLTRNVHLEPTGRALVASLATVCRQMKITVVAEGVESEPQRDQLASAGCELFQGFLFGGPEQTLPDPVRCGSNGGDAVLSPTRL